MGQALAVINIPTYMEINFIIIIIINFISIAPFKIRVTVLNKYITIQCRCNDGGS